VTRQKEILIRILSVSFFLIGFGLLIWRREIPDGSISMVMLMVISLPLPCLAGVAFFTAFRTTAVTVGHRIAYCGFAGLALFPFCYFISGGEKIGLMGVGFFGLGFSIGALLPKKNDITRNLEQLSSTKIIYIEGDQLRTRGIPAVKQLHLSETSIEIFGDPSKSILFSDIQNISQERMPGSGSIIKIQAANRTIFISAIRWHFLGQILVVNYFKTQALFNYLSARCPGRSSLT
jgi:hypothetical protein